MNISDKKDFLSPYDSITVHKKYEFVILKHMNFYLVFFTIIKITTITLISWLFHCFHGSCCKHLHWLILEHPRMLSQYLQIYICILLHSLYFQGIPYVTFTVLSWIIKYTSKAYITKTCVEIFTPNFAFFLHNILF